LKGKTVLRHLTFWALIYLAWVAIFRTYSVSLSKTMTIEFCYLVFITADYYIVNNFIVPHFLDKKKYFPFISATLITIAFSAALRSLVALQMNVHFFHALTIPDFRTLYVNSLINISVWVLLITTGKMLTDRIQTEFRLELAEKERVKNELDYLKAQINPHALFNSLNTIYGHIDRTNQTARNILLQFSELLRYQLYDCNAETVSLTEEIAYLKNYIAFQRLRKNEKLVVSLQIEEGDRQLRIAPLLLVVLIENAFKFVSDYTDRENKICIKIAARDEILYCSFKNTREETRSHPEKKSYGIGIQNLKRRLELLYSQKYEWFTKTEPGYYETHLNINLS